MADPTCAIPECPRSGPYRRGWCATHYARWYRSGTAKPEPAWGTPLARLHAKTTITADGCWHYDGQPSTRYPQVRIDGRRWDIHRWSYTVHRGPIPDGYDVDHRCRVSHCWNPDHLRAIPSLDNSTDNRRANSFSSQTHCVNGHEFTRANTYRPPREPNRRMCRTCRR